jgi:ribonuclease P protein component
MLKRQNRLAKTKDVKTALSRGRSFFNPFFTVKFLKTFRTKPRFTVVVSTKVSKKAVRRNRLKRIIRELIRQNIENFFCGEYVIIVKPKAVTQDEKDLLAGLEKLFKYSRLLE